ncbi:MULTISPECIES: DNA polymerase III subunit gamma/tau [unclassified Dehalobacter]|uniref:DNA polymerase III subunit gamma/tau n=1 Tax=unclassified Dehalobacter TaxID=2635733 RepID=UPI000E6BDAB1|nr:MULTISPECIES: DNA polymerase III subunit gamma/tau [unclassified Dehalobacter]RJE47852.1 DNA polymerase III subunit gamma/tau [Dehalobacter sp. MCB1]TCX48995.1 DNA polymerase III subunit gamma/tau [Dehalobacter sp. 14DCB1]TCX56683.1 DNA polymerase III subunit gamma/tau [Dehalobacter sp. 12DCB1]
MAYLALYREWRPKKFSEIVGQEHVKITLTNALNQNKVAHAYMFSGPRGTGKTSAAKILAKALNCSDRDGAEPCSRCASCLDIDQGNAMDVLEIDAASNRGIDEIRDLREKVKLASSGGKYKVYIIDEVHMLTPEAFNALLKTLEEPPVNVVFVLATTEAHKVPLTILSRVQRFEFHRISAEGIAMRLQEVCQALGRDIETKALQVIAAKAEGGLRDALSILDQCLLQDDPIGTEHVYQVIGMVGETFSADLTDSLLNQDYALTLIKLGEGISLGRDPRQIIRELLDYLRQALLYLAGGQEPLMAPEMTRRLVVQSQTIGLNRLLCWINVLMKGEGELRYATNARLAAEMILVQTIFGTNTAGGSNDITENQPKKTHIKQPQKSVQATGNHPTESKDEASTKAVETSRQDQKITEVLPAEQGNINIQTVQDKWSGILEEVRKQKRSTHAFLLEGKPLAVKNDQVYLVFKDGYSFHRDKFNQVENKNVVEEVLLQTFGKKLSLNNLIESEVQALPAEAADSSESKKKVTDRTKPAEDDYLVQKARELFGDQLVQVRKEK